MPLSPRRRAAILMALACALLAAARPAVLAGETAGATGGTGAAGAAGATNAAAKAPVEVIVGNRGAAPPAPRAGSGAATGKPAAAQKIDLNTASEEQLAALPGIGEIRARSIVRNRPYARKDDLVRKKVIPKSVYESLRERVVAHR
ncbi:MAG: helix-hairpin-helix domain-containing protein [Burkholderiaceae bacterium]|nr:helix-hairpin-helix domain-containing protein [Burkholderiaceae bacterium]